MGKHRGGKIYGEGSFGIVGDVDDICNNNNLTDINGNRTLDYSNVNILRNSYVLKIFKGDYNGNNFYLNDELKKNTLIRQWFKKSELIKTLLHPEIAAIRCSCSKYLNTNTQVCNLNELKTSIPYKKFDGSVYDDIIEKRSIRLTFYDLVHLVKDSCTFLKVLAEKKYYHFDIKPENILYKKNQNGTLSFVVSDYGSISQTRDVCTALYVPGNLLLLQNELRVFFSFFSVNHWVEDDMIQNSTFNKWMEQKEIVSEGWNIGIWNDLYALSMTMYNCIPLIPDDKHRAWARNLFKQLFTFETYEDIIKLCSNTEAHHRDLESAEQLSKNEDIIKWKQEWIKLNNYRDIENRKAETKLREILDAKNAQIKLLQADEYELKQKMELEIGMLEKQLRRVYEDIVVQEKKVILYKDNINALQKQIDDNNKQRTGLVDSLVKKEAIIQDLLIEQKENQVRFREYDNNIAEYLNNIQRLQEVNINALVKLRKAQTDATEQRNIIERLKWYKEIECAYECQNNNTIASRILPRRDEIQKCIPGCVEKKMTEVPQPGLNTGWGDPNHPYGGSAKKHVLYNMHQYVVHKQGKHKFIKVHKKHVFLSDIKGQYSYVKQVLKKTRPKTVRQLFS